ncbi:unnamed protein product [Diamesa hyperborea]
MHNVSSDQIERNIRLIQLVQKHPAIYNHDPAQGNGESAEEIWVKIAQDLGADTCKKKWRLLRSSLIRYIKVFKDKSTSKGNRYRPYYLLKHMEFLLPYIDDKGILKKIKVCKPAITTSIHKKDRSDEETILYTSPNTITYSVSTVPTTSSVKESSEHLKSEIQQHANQEQQDIQQFYNNAHHHAGVKILGEDFISYPAGEQQIIYQASNACTEDIQQECITQDTEMTQNQQVQEYVTQEGSSQSIKQQQQQQQLAPTTTIIPIPNFNHLLTTGTTQQNESASADMYFLIGLLPDFRTLSNDQKRKLKIGILKLLDDACSAS